MPLHELRGQDAAVEILRRMVAAQHVPHALLFTGPEGVGKRAAALDLAQALNCLAPVDGEACGQCLACRKIASGSHPDVRVLEPEESHLKIDQIREELQHDAALMPMEGRRKVYILDPADALTPGAANSLLKILEEPPATVLLVLLTSQPFALLDTIRSRCQEVRFRPLPTEELTAWLANRLACSVETARTLARLSGGRPAEALRLQAAETQELRAEVLALVADESGPWTEAARRLGEHQEELPQALGMLLTWYRDLMLLASGAPAELLLNVDRRTELAAALAGETTASLERKCQAILTATDQLERNQNAQLVLEVMFMQLLKKIPVSASPDRAAGIEV